MNIPTKYEDVVAQLDAAEVIIQAGEHVESHLEKQIDILRIDLDAALGREAALREELDLSISDRHEIDRMYDRSERKNNDLQQRLTVAEQRAAELESAAREMLRIAGIANQGSNAYNRAIINMHAALNPATGRGGCGSGKPVPPSKPVAPPIRRVVNELVINKAEIEAHTTRNWRS